MAPVTTFLTNGSYPDVPDGKAYVQGYLGAFNNYKAALNGALGQANALDTSADISTFNSNLHDVSTSVNNARSTFTSSWNGVDSQFTNPGDNPLVHALNGDTNCDTFRNGG